MAHLDIRQGLVLARTHFSSGRLTEAEGLCRQILDAQPDNLAALFILGLLACRTGRADQGVELLRCVAEARPGEAELQASFAEALAQIGRLEEAAAVCRQALTVQPDHPRLLLIFANVLKDQGQGETACALYRRALALQPDLFQAHVNLGVALRVGGQLDEAVLSLQRAIALRPDSAEAHYNLGNILREAGDMAEAAQSYRRALAHNPGDLAARVNLAATLVAGKQAAEAVVLLRDTVALHSLVPEVHLHLALALAGAGEPQEALAACHRALSLRPDWAEALFDLANLHFQEDRLEAAETAYRQALAQQPDYPDALLNLGALLRAQGRLDEAVASYRRVIALRPDDRDAHVNLAHVLLQQGDFAQGWQEYEWRRRGEFFVKRTRFVTTPQWAGENLTGRTILLYAEQGAGDTIQFLRYAPLLTARGARVVLEVQQSLVRLAQTVPGVAAVVGQGDDLPPADFHLPLLSLPAFLGTVSEAAIPATIPYLEATAPRVSLWRRRLTAEGGLRVGVVWSGSGRHADDRHRSLSAVELLPRLDLPGIRLFSLQKNASVGDQAFLQSEQCRHVTDLSPLIGDFADTAAAMTMLDLVITADTAPAHLAGALGRPAWVLLSSRADWRWLEGREDSPWYPSLRLLRQTEAGDWRPLIGKLVDNLIDWRDRRQGGSSL